MKKRGAVWIVLVLLTAVASPALGRASRVKPVRFAVLGDFGNVKNRVNGGSPAADVARMVECWDATFGLDFVITLGDNNYPKGEASTIDANVGQLYGDFIESDPARNRFWPVLGNHDYGLRCPDPSGAQAYFDYFQALGRRRYYDRRYGPVHVFAVNSDCNEDDNRPDGSEAGSRQRSWLKEALSGSDAPWRIVYFHHPPYTSGFHRDTKSMRWPFKAWGASVVLCGHDHDYERLEVGGLTYIVNGLGGTEPRGFMFREPGSKIRFNGDYGAILVTATESSLVLQFVTRGGTVVDTYYPTPLRYPVEVVPPPRCSQPS